MPEPTQREYKYKSYEHLKTILQQLEEETRKKMRNYRSTDRGLVDLIDRCYDQADTLVEKGDLESAYLLFYKCFHFVLYYKKYHQDCDGNYIDQMTRKPLKNALLRCEKLDDILKTEYKKLNVPKIKEPPDKSINSTVTFEFPQIVGEKNGYYLNTVNDAADPPCEERISITCEELFKTALKAENRAFLLIDIRLKEDYTLSRILMRSVDVINVPENLIEPSLIPSKWETKLEEEFRDMFKKRGEYGQVILLDWFSTRSSFVSDNSSPIYLISSKLIRFDPKVKYKNKPVILEGGYNDWLDRYPTYTTNGNVIPPKKIVADSRISIDHINYPTNSFFEPEKVIEQKPATPTPPQNTSNKSDVNNSTITKPVVQPQENGSKPTFDRSTKPILQEKPTDTTVKENGISAQPEKKSIPEQTTEQLPPTNETPVPEKRVESFEEDEEELKNKCIRNGRRSALTSLSNQPISINNNNNAGSIDSDEDFDAAYRDEEKENRMNAMKNARVSLRDETSSNLKRYSSTPNISKLENEYSKPTIDRSTKPSNDDQINIFTKTAMYTDEEGRGLTGLMNCGNTCYMNSILQCLSNTKLFREFMCTLSYGDMNPKSKTEGLIAREVSNIMKQLWMKDNGPVVCMTLKNIVGKHRDSFKGSEQQDAHEFLTILIDWLHEDLNKPTTDRLLLKGADEKSGEKAWGEFTCKNNSKIRLFFYGQQKSTVSCNTCQKESVTFEPFSNLSLPIPSSDKCTLAECFKLYTSNEHITGWQCPACKIPRSATKKLDITKLPPLLVIHFKRFTSGGRCQKCTTNVDFPNLLDMTPYIIGQEHRNRRYELYAVSNHMGGMETGHYTAYCRNSVNGRWYKFDDDSVSSLNNVPKSFTAYIVFYQCLLDN